MTIIEPQAVRNSTHKTKRFIKQFLVKFSMSAAIGILKCRWFTVYGIFISAEVS